MKPRESKKIKSKNKSKKSINTTAALSEELVLEGVVRALDETGLLVNEDKKKQIITQLIQDNANTVKVNKVVGANNTVLFLEERPVVVLISQITQSAREMVSAVLTNTDSPSYWLAKEYQVSQSRGKYDKKNGINQNRNTTYPSQFNDFDKSQFISVSVVESFPASLVSYVENNLENTTTDDKAQLAYSVGAQTCEMIESLNKANCIWTDLKPGNILMRENNSIGVADIKAFQPYQQTLVKQVTPYDAIASELITRNEEDFNRKSNTLQQGQFLIRISTNEIDDINAVNNIEYAIKNSDGQVIKGDISLEELKNKFNDEDKYNKFIDQISNQNSNASINLANSKILFSIAADQGKALSSAYRLVYLDQSPSYLTHHFKSVQDARYESPELARKSGLELWNKEYSYQLAVILYFVATGKEKLQMEAGEEKTVNLEKDDRFKFDFDLPVFQSEQGRILANLITELSKENPEERMSYQDAAVILRQYFQPEFKIKEEMKVNEEIPNPENKFKIKKSLIRATSTMFDKNKVDKYKTEKVNKENNTVKNENVVKVVTNSENIEQGQLKPQQQENTIPEASKANDEKVLKKRSYYQKSKSTFFTRPNVNINKDKEVKEVKDEASNITKPEDQTKYKK